MRYRVFGFLLAILICAGPLSAQQGLRSLETGDAARAWEAVGRLDLGGVGFCTASLIAEDLVLTSAHCLFDKPTGARIDPARITFLAGWRNGRAAAYRGIRRTLLHPGYEYSSQVSAARVRTDLALLELQRPVRNTTITPFDTADGPPTGAEVGVVSYARNRAEAPSLQEVCEVLTQQPGMLVTSCTVDLGSSGAPVFVFSYGRARIVSVVSAKAELEGAPVALATSLQGPLEDMLAALAAGGGVYARGPQAASRVRVGGARAASGAKFLRPGG